MVFKKLSKSNQAPSSPEKLILELPRRKIPGVLAHQSEVMKNYAELAAEKPDVALQLPTGSGKTLVGTLTAEWIRRRRGERVVYLAPTKQLVNQVVNQCEQKYGIQANGFTGPATSYSPQARSEYKTAEKIAVTTYSSLFNTNPFFKDAETIIVDDAHAAENYIAKMWSVSLDRINHNQSAAYIAAMATLRPYLDDSTIYKVKSPKEANNGWIDKLPTFALYQASNDIRAVLDEHASTAGVWHEWSLVRDHLHACHLYFNESQLLIRPLIPPTWTHVAFNNARQRIYMSATLGAGGDLERLFGRKTIYRVPIPNDWDTQGVGRRLFLFPNMSLDENQCSSLRLKMMKQAGRSLVLVPSRPHSDQIRAEVESKISYKTLSAEDIESSKHPFVESDNAVAIIANRYDGIDFPGDDCRLMFVEGLPTATNMQERFLMSRMAANILFNERVQTRVLQAVGRCTRSLEDYSAVVVTGLDLQDYLTDKKRRRHLHPELQAELQFGIEQSMDSDSGAFADFLRVFLSNGDEWESANKDIIELKDGLSRHEFPGISELEATVSFEIDYQRSLWQGDYVDAMDAAARVLGLTTGDDLRGYRALWNYLAGSSAHLAFISGALNNQDKANSYYFAAKNAAVGLHWLVKLATGDKHNSALLHDPDDALRMEQVENIESILEKLGASHDRKYAAREREIISGIESADDFERSHVLLGELLGFHASKREADGSPDPWWHIGNLCFVFEDHAGAKDTSFLSVEKARQTAGHPKWIKENVPEMAAAEIIPILVSPVQSSSVGAKPHLNDVCLWPLNEFRAWAVDALGVIREIRKTFSSSGDIAWRAEAARKLRLSRLDAPSIRLDRLDALASNMLSFY